MEFQTATKRNYFGPKGMYYVTWTLLKCQQVHVESFKSKCIFEGSNAGAISFLESPGNIALVDTCYYDERPSINLSWETRPQPFLYFFGKKYSAKPFSWQAF